MAEWKIEIDGQILNPDDCKWHPAWGSNKMLTACTFDSGCYIRGDCTDANCPRKASDAPTEPGDDIVENYCKYCTYKKNP